MKQYARMPDLPATSAASSALPGTDTANQAPARTGAATRTPCAPWWGPARMPFLLLTLACMAWAVACCRWLAQHGGNALHWSDAALATLGALAAHVGTNALNEYVDFRSGLDACTQRTPFSGGSGTLPARPRLAAVALGLGVGGLALSAALGLYFLWHHPASRPLLLPLGLAGLALAAAYTPWITRHPWLCLLAPGLGFGPLMTLGTAAVLLDGPGPQAIATMAVVALLPFGLANALLLLNQYPDIEADRRVGRRTLPMVLGPSRTWPVLALQYLLAYGALLACVGALGLPRPALLGLLTAPLAARTVHGAMHHAHHTAALLPTLRRNVRVCLLTLLLAAMGVAMGS